jgi:hypothetical protein
MVIDCSLFYSPLYQLPSRQNPVSDSPKEIIPLSGLCNTLSGQKTNFSDIHNQRLQPINSVSSTVKDGTWNFGCQFARQAEVNKASIVSAVAAQKPGVLSYINHPIWQTFLKINNLSLALLYHAGVTMITIMWVQQQINLLQFHKGY